MCDLTPLYQTILSQMNHPDAFTRSIGISITYIGPHEAAGELLPDSVHANPLGTIHGGAICTLMDAVGGAAGASSGFGCATIDCTIHFFRASKPSEQLFCRAETLKAGRRIQVFDVSVTNRAGSLLAKGTYTYQLLNRIESEVLP